MKQFCLLTLTGVGVFLQLILMPIPMASAQVAVRDLCNDIDQFQIANIEVEKIEVDRPKPFNEEVTTPAPSKTPDGARSSENESGKSKLITGSAAVQAAYRNCVQPSPIGFHYAPDIDAKVHHEYEKRIINAKGITEKGKLSHIVVNMTANATTPPGIFLHHGDNVKGPFRSLQQCMQARRQDANTGVCGSNEGPVFISLTGIITNHNSFPLHSVTMECDYVDAVGKLKSLRAEFSDVISEEGYIPYEDKVIAELPPHSQVNNISCKPSAAAVWQPTDNIQTLNMPFQP